MADGGPPPPGSQLQGPKHQSTLTNPKPSFADLLKGNQSSAKSNNSRADESAGIPMSVFELKPISKHQGKPAIIFRESEKKSLLEKLNHVLIAKWSHGRPSMSTIRNFFINLHLKGDFNLAFYDSKHMFVECVMFEDFVKLWLKIEWVIHGFPLRVFKWSDSFHPSIESAIAPIWIHLPRLPLFLYDEATLLSIANAIGRPLKIDPCNILRTKLGCASICVEVDVSIDRVDEIWISFTKNGTDSLLEGFWQKVVYGAMPSFCKGCEHLGHSVSSCKRPSLSKNGLAGSMEQVVVVSNRRMNLEAATDPVLSVPVRTAFCSLKLGLSGIACGSIEQEGLLAGTSIQSASVIETPLQVNTSGSGQIMMMHQAGSSTTEGEQAVGEFPAAGGHAVEEPDGKHDLGHVNGETVTIQSEIADATAVGEREHTAAIQEPSLVEHSKTNQQQKQQISCRQIELQAVYARGTAALYAGADLLTINNSFAALDEELAIETLEEGEITEEHVCAAPTKVVVNATDIESAGTNNQELEYQFEAMDKGVEPSQSVQDAAESGDAAAVIGAGNAVNPMNSVSVIDFESVANAGDSAAMNTAAVVATKGSSYHVKSAAEMGGEQTVNVAKEHAVLVDKQGNMDVHQVQQQDAQGTTLELNCTSTTADSVKIDDAPVISDDKKHAAVAGNVATTRPENETIMQQLRRINRAEKAKKSAEKKAKKAALKLLRKQTGLDPDAGLIQDCTHSWAVLVEEGKQEAHTEVEKVASKQEAVVKQNLSGKLHSFSPAGRTPGQIEGNAGVAGNDGQIVHIERLEQAGQVAGNSDLSMHIAPRVLSPDAISFSPGSLATNTNAEGHAWGIMVEKEDQETKDKREQQLVRELSAIRPIRSYSVEEDLQFNMRNQKMAKEVSAFRELYGSQLKGQALGDIVLVEEEEQESEEFTADAITLLQERLHRLRGDNTDRNPGILTDGMEDIHRPFKIKSAPNSPKGKNSSYDSSTYLLSRGLF